MTDTIQLNGRTYTVTIEPDTDMGAPWEEQAGHGVVSEWTTRSKRAGELVLVRDLRRYLWIACGDILDGNA